jgi:hypothetical protein
LLIVAIVIPPAGLILGIFSVVRDRSRLGRVQAHSLLATTSDGLFTLLCIVAIILGNLAVTSTSESLQLGSFCAGYSADQRDFARVASIDPKIFGPTHTTAPDVAQQQDAQTGLEALSVDLPTLVSNSSAPPEIAPTLRLLAENLSVWTSPLNEIKSGDSRVSASVHEASKVDKYAEAACVASTGY